MTSILRNILAVLIGIVVGGIVNMAIIFASPHVIPPPPGVNVNDSKSLAENMHLFEAKHFVFPFLAHAIGTLGGAVLAYVIAANRKAIFAYVIGGFFLAGGIMACLMIPAPAWFIALDLLGAYLPMAWLATLIGKKVLAIAQSKTRIDSRT